jgi:hypothetical protein
MRKQNIRLLGDAGFVRWTDEEDACSKIRSGLWEQVTDPMTGRFQGLRKIVFHPKPSGSPSPASITARESRANVGIWDGTAGAEAKEVTGLISAARSKLFFWPMEGDDRAVRVACRASS